MHKVEWLYLKLFNFVLQFFDIKSDRHRQLQVNSRSEEFTIQFLIDFFNLKIGREDEDAFKLKKNKQFEMSEDSGKRILLILDNCQELFEHEDKKFKQFLHKLSDECENITILVVTRNELTGMPDVKPWNVQLNKIKSTEDAITFFEKRIDDGINGVLYNNEAALLIAKTNSETYLDQVDQDEI